MGDFGNGVGGTAEFVGYGVHGKPDFGVAKLRRLGVFVQTWKVRTLKMAAPTTPSSSRYARLRFLLGPLSRVLTRIARLRRARSTKLKPRRIESRPEGCLGHVWEICPHFDCIFLTPQDSNVLKASTFAPMSADAAPSTEYGVQCRDLLNGNVGV